jgi:hypothetical protein
MLSFGNRGSLTAAFLFCLCARVAGPLQAQTAPASNTITIRMYDGRTGRQIKPDNFLVRLNHQEDLHNETLSFDDEGTGQITVPADASFLSVQGTFDRSMEIYLNCDSGKEKDDRRLHWYSIGTILSTGVIAPNECFNGKYERPRIAVKPGEFLFYVQPHKWRDPSSF